MVNYKNVNVCYANCAYLVGVFLVFSIIPSGLSQRQRYYVQNGNGTATMVVHNGQLERIHDRITALKDTDDELLKKLEAIEYKLTQLEVVNQDRWNSMEIELRDINRFTQNIDNLALKTDTTIEQLKTEMESLNYRLSTQGVPAAVNDGVPQQRSVGDLNSSDKLDALATYLTSTRNAMFRLENLAMYISSNVSLLSDELKEIRKHQQRLPTKQFLHSALHGVRSQPIYAVMPHNQGSAFVGAGGATSRQLPSTCLQDILVRTGLLKIQTSPLMPPFFVYCDGETDNGGWIVIQRRRDGSVNFNRGWLEYKMGFGNLEGEFFIGLDKLHELTESQLHELYIQLEDFDGAKKYAKYAYFGIGGEKEDYALSILGAYAGDAGDALTYSASYKFSTFDNDNDGWVEGNCAKSHTGAWWFNACEMSNLNGQYLAGPIGIERIFQGVYWQDFRGANYSMKNVTMMIRPVEYAAILQT